VDLHQFAHCPLNILEKGWFSRTSNSALGGGHPAVILLGSTHFSDSTLVRVIIAARTAKSLACATLQAKVDCFLQKSIRLEDLWHWFAKKRCELLAHELQRVP
jgi:hypothetical protein